MQRRHNAKEKSIATSTNKANFNNETDSHPMNIATESGDTDDSMGAQSLDDSVLSEGCSPSTPMRPDIRKSGSGGSSHKDGMEGLRALIVGQKQMWMEAGQVCSMSHTPLHSLTLS